MSERPDCYGVKVRKARKPHKCYECGGVIEKGEQYNYHHGVWDHEAASYKVCTDCDGLREDCDATAEYDGDRTAFGNLCDSAQGMGGEYFLRYVEIQRKRGAEISDWQLKEEAETKARGGL